MRCKEFTWSEYESTDAYETILNAYIFVKTELEKWLAKLQGSTTASPATSSATQQSATPLAWAENVSLYSQLKLESPRYDGDSLKWESFRDHFKSLVIDAPCLSNARKLLHLQSLLTGEGADSIANTQPTDSNFAGAWEDLEARYGISRITSSFYMKSLFSIPQAQKSNPLEIKRLIDSFRKSIRIFDRWRNQWLTRTNFLLICSSRYWTIQPGWFGKRSFLAVKKFLRLKL